MGEKVLIVDDEQEIADLVAVYLESMRYISSTQPKRHLRVLRQRS